MELKLYQCAHCGNIVFKLVDSGVPMICCGAPMGALKANTTDGAVEKHVPVIEESGHAVHVKVGSVAHPMLAEHYIPVIALTGDNTVVIKFPKPGEEPSLTTAKPDGKMTAYEICNLHGFWKSER